MSNWFVFHEQTGEERKACELLNKLLHKEESVAFVSKMRQCLKIHNLFAKCLDQCSQVIFSPIQF